MGFRTKGSIIEFTALRWLSLMLQKLAVLACVASAASAFFDIPIPIGYLLVAAVALIAASLWAQRWVYPQRKNGPFALCFFEDAAQLLVIGLLLHTLWGGGAWYQSPGVAMAAFALTVTWRRAQILKG